MKRAAKWSAALLGLAAMSATGVAGMTQFKQQDISVARADAGPSSAGPPENFTGRVRVQGRFQRDAPARIGGAGVSFDAGARTAWHTHPLGQTLIVTTGLGLVQQWNEPAQQIRPGDMVWIPPGVKHWHGASPKEGMTHIALAEALNGTSVEWMEKVSDEQYRAAAPSSTHN